MWIQPLRTSNDVAAFILRLALGIVMFPHGAQKLLGWFGGSGFGPTVQHFTANMGIPWVLAVGVILVEFFGSILLVAGFLTHLWSLAIGVVMAVAVAMVHWQHGFFMNWFGQQQGEGFEYHILAIAIALALLIKGGGALSVDGLLSKRNVQGRLG